MAYSNSSVTSDGDKLLSVAYQDLERTNKQLEEATITLYRLKLLKIQCFPYPSDDHDELYRERSQCFRVLFGKPGWVTGIFESEWWIQAMADGLGDSADLLDDRMRSVEADKLELETAQSSIRTRIANLTRDQVRDLNILDLPDEILVAICQHVENIDLPCRLEHDWGDGKDIVSVRQVCRRFCYASSGFLVRRVCVDASKASLARLEEISRHPAIAPGVYHVKIFLRFFNPSLTNIAHFALYHANRILARAEIRRATRQGMDDIDRNSMVTVAGLGWTLRRLASTPTSILGNLSDVDKQAMVRLGQAHLGYLRLLQEQEWLMKEGRFAQAAGSAMARMPRARNLEIVDTDLPEVALVGQGNDLWDALDRYTHQPMGGLGAIACSGAGIEPPSYKWIDDFLNGVRDGGAWVDTMAISLHSPGLLGSMAPIPDTGRELASSLQKLRKFDFKIKAEMSPGSVGDVEKFLSACIDTPSLEYLGVDLSGHHEVEPSIDIGRILGSAPRKLLTSVWLCRVDFHLSDLRVFLDRLDGKHVSLSMADMFMCSGTWKECLDILRNMEARCKWFRRPAGQEIDEMSGEEYRSIFNGELGNGGGGIAQLYISKKLSGWSAPNPIQALEERRAAAAALAV